MPRATRAVLASAVALLGVLVLAPAAMAGTIRYTIAPSPAYTIQDNGQGIVKVTYNGCVTANERQELRFQVVTNVSQDANATFNVLREEGENPTATFNPASVALRRGPDQTFDVILAFTLTEENNNATTFRFKLDPESGEGLGQGAGVMVTIPCVIPARAASGQNFPATTSPQASRSAPCVATRPVVLRVGARRALVARVTTSGQRIAGAFVRVTGPGFTRTLRTNSQGEATFRIRPTRRGTVFVQSNVCIGADRVAVLGAFAPRFTG